MFPLAEAHGVQCWRCGSVDELEALIRAVGGFEGLQVEKEEGEQLWVPDGGGWLCPSCGEEEKEREYARNNSMVTVPEPPSERRYCQSCGEKLPVSQLDGQFCEECKAAQDGEVSES